MSSPSRILMVIFSLCLLAPRAHADTAGRFDYYLLSLSWSPQFCATEASDDDPQCGRLYGFVVHGLWPQNERGYPRDCGRGEYLEDSLIHRMLPVMPSKKLIIHEWKAHGVCSGLSSRGYFGLVEQVRAKLVIPEVYRTTGLALTRTIPELKQEFIAANPGLKPNHMSLQCAGNYLKEVRICFNRDLQPRACGSDLRDTCSKKDSFALRPWR